MTSLSSLLVAIPHNTDADSEKQGAIPQDHFFSHPAPLWGLAIHDGPLGQWIITKTAALSETFKFHPTSNWNNVDLLLDFPQENS